MNIQEIREKLINFPKYAGTKQYPSASVCNDGFPSCFNLSFAENELFKEFGQYLNYDKDLIYSKIQPCIRHQDFDSILKDSDDRYKYLSVFDMADVGGFIVLLDGQKQEETIKFSITSMLKFLEEVGLDKNNLKISCFDETSINEATAGKYPLDKKLPTDPMLNYWKEVSKLTDDHFIADHTRDTLLSLRVFGLPTPWGYRNEIFYNHKGKLLDIGTVEYLPYRPVYDDEGKITDIVEFNHSVAISAVGVERIAMAVNGLDNVWEVDTIAPLIQQITEISKTNNAMSAMIVAQSLRAIHRVVTDAGTYSSLNNRRKEYLRNFYRAFFQELETLGIESESSLYKDLLAKNAELQPFYPELSESIDKTITEIEIRKQSFLEDKSLKRGVAQ